MADVPEDDPQLSKFRIIISFYSGWVADFLIPFMPKRWPSLGAT